MDKYMSILDRVPALLSFAILISTVLILSLVVRRLWVNVFLKLSRITETKLDEYFFTATMGPAQFVFIAAGFRFAWEMYGDAIFSSLQIIPNLNTGFIHSICNELSFLFLAATLIVFFWKSFFSIIDWLERDYARRTETHLDEKIVPTLRKILKVTAIVFIFMFISDHYGWPLTKLWAAAGIGSLAVAFAARDTFANIISGIIILIERPFLIGDRIELQDGTFGDVVDIGLRSTKILSFDNTIYILPNTEISNKRVTNHCYPDITIKIRHNIGVAYGTDLLRVKKVIAGILEKHPDVLNTPEWGIYFMNFGESALDLLVIYWISNYQNKFTIIDEINMEIKRRFEEENIVIPFPQRNIHMIGN